MTGISSVGASSAITAASSSPTKQRMEVSVLKMQQNQAKADGEAAVRLMDAAAEVRMTGKGGRVDVRG